MTNPTNPKESSWFSKTKGKMKKAFQPSTGGNGHAPSGTLAPKPTAKLSPPVQNNSSPPKLSPTPSKPAPAATPEPKSAVPPTFNPDIFPSAISRSNDIQPPNIAQRIDSTAQLVHCARLLQLAKSPSFSLSALNSSSSKVQPEGQPDLSLKDREWIKSVKDLSVEKDRIQQLLIGVVNAFILDPVKDKEAIREVVIVGPVLQKDHFRALLICFLTEFRNAPLLEIGKLPGLIQLVQDAPPDYLETNDLIDILELIRKRLEGTDTHTEKYLFQLTLAISKVLSVMADLNIKELDRVNQHEPLRTILAGLKSSDNQYLRYQAIYAVQALRCVPDDETPARCFFRHFVKIAGSAIKLSGVLQVDINGFAAGAKEIQSSVSDLYDFVKSTVEEDLPALMEDGAGLVTCLKNMAKSEKRHPWYISLRAAEDLVQIGNFPALKELVFSAQSHDSYLFQWGICQLLGEVAVDPSWNKDIQIHAVLFLAEMSKISQHVPVKELILTILTYIATFSDGPIKSKAADLLDDLKDGRKEAIPLQYFVGHRLLLPQSSPLLFKVNKTANLEPILLKIKMEITQGRPEMYIPLMSKANPKDSGEKLDPLDKRVEDFLDSKNEVMLILGGSGAGKTTFNRHLERTLWERYQPNGAIPLFIDLKAMGNLKQIDIVEKRLAHYGFKPDEVRELKEYRRVLLICDGYDEAKTFVNIHSQLKGQRWRSFQIVVSCRSQYLATTNYRSYFAPQQPYGQRQQALFLFEEAVVMPFKDDQIRDYIEKFLETDEAKRVFGHQPFWTSDYYFAQLSHLMELVKNPFMLQLALTTLPGIVDKETGLPKVLKTRFELFLAFGEQHFEKELGRLSLQRGGDMPQDEANAFDILQNCFFGCGLHFSMRLAHAIFVNNEGVNLVEYSSKEKQGWKTPFFSPKSKAENRLLRSTIQVARHIVEESGKYGISSSKDVYSFIHRSIMEFYCSCQLCDIVTDPLGEEGYSHETQHPVLEECLHPTATPLLLSGHPLNHRSIVSEPSIVHFLVEHSQMHPEYQEQLRLVIERSKVDKTVSQAAANAITVLVKAGVQFSGEDLSGIRVPGADLSGGYFDSALLKDADLTGVNLTKTWLRQADFGNADMKGTQFGELPFLMFPDSTAGSLAVSPSGKDVAIGLGNGEIKVLDTSDWSTRLTLQGHTDRVWGLFFSGTGNQLASAGGDSDIRIWDFTQATPTSRVLKGHSLEVNMVVFSPDERRIASTSMDKTVRIWDIESGSAIHVKDDNLGPQKGVAWSPDGQQIATGGLDKKIRLWKVESGELVQLLSPQDGHGGGILYTPDGEHLIAGVGEDVYIWDLPIEGKPLVLKGHTDVVRSVAVSHDGQWIASCSPDRVVRLWNRRTGAPILTLNGHVESIGKVMFLSDQELVSCSYEGMMRIWELSEGIAHDGTLSGMAGTSAAVRGHRDNVTSVAYSPDCESILTGSDDKTVKEWNARTGDSKVLVDHPSQVLTVPSDPPGPKTIQDWDTEPRPTKTTIHCPSRILSVAYSPESLPLAITEVTEEGMVYKLNIGGEAIAVDGCIQVEDDNSMAVYSPCGRWLALGESSGTIKVWDRQSDAAERTLVGHSSTIKGLAFSPDGLQLASWSEDFSARFWDVEAATSTGVLDKDVKSMAFSPCGTMLVWSPMPYIPFGAPRDSDSWRTVHILDMKSQQVIFELKGHKSGISSVAWFSEGIVSSDDDPTVRLWRQQVNGSESVWSCVSIVHDLSQTVFKLAWRPSAESLPEFVAVCWDGSVSVWTVMESKDEIDKGQGVSVRLKWNSTIRLTATGAKITDALGLDEMQRRLLRQRGAIDDSVLSNEVEGLAIGPE